MSELCIAARLELALNLCKRQAEYSCWRDAVNRLRVNGGKDYSGDYYYFADGSFFSVSYTDEDQDHSHEYIKTRNYPIPVNKETM